MIQSLLETHGYRGDTPRPVPSHDEEVFIDQQPFTTSLYPRDMLSIAFIIGVRANDGSEYPVDDFLDRAKVDNEDSLQPIHCLRQLADDGSIGDRSALARCRAAILSEAEAALDGLAADGSVDPAYTERVPVFIPFQGLIQWPLSPFYYHAGRALHILEDSFAHTYREPTWHKVVAVMNWVDPVRGGSIELRDGPPHESYLDRCQLDRPWGAGQWDAALQASRELYAVLLSAPATSRDAARQALNDVLDRWFGYQAGCDVTNRYCENPVYIDLMDSGLSNGANVSGCSAGGQATGNGALALFAVALLIGLGKRRGAPIAALVLVTLLALSTRAGADEPAVEPPPAGELSLPIVTAPVVIAPPKIAAPVELEPPAPGAPAAVPPAAPAPVPAREDGLMLQGIVRASLSLTQATLALSGGVLLSRRNLEAEFNVEWNPFISWDTLSVAAGVLNIYALGAYRWRVSRTIDISTAAGIGASILLFETIGSPAGTVGPLMMWRPLGITHRLSRRVAVAVNAFELAVAMPQTRGYPLTVIQYRLSAGLRF